METNKKTMLERVNILLIETDGAYHDIALRMGMSDSALYILYAVCSCGSSCLLSEITACGISKQTVNSALRKLEKDGMVFLESSGGRKKRVCLTAEGETYADNTVRRIISMENMIFDGWPEEDRIKYIELNQRYLNELREKMQEL